MIYLNFRKRLGDFELSIDAKLSGKVTAFFGPSGSGKSTLLNCVSGILNPDEGEVRLDELCLFSSKSQVSMPPEKRRFGYVFQEGRLFPHMSVKKNISYGQSKKSKIGIGTNIDIEKVIEVLEIKDLLERYPAQLSIGQRQRVALARALAISPKLLLMDEPLASLDEPLKHQILPYLRYVKEMFEIPILYVTHSISEVIALSDEMFILKGGKVIDHGSPFDLLNSPPSLATAQITGVENILELSVKEKSEKMGITTLELGEQSLYISYCDTAPGSRVRIAIRAKDIIVSTQFHFSISARNKLQGVIKNISVNSGKVLLQVDVEGRSLLVEITRDALEDLKLKAGERYCFIIKASSIHVLEVRE